MAQVRKDMIGKLADISPRLAAAAFRAFLAAACMTVAAAAVAHASGGEEAATTMDWVWRVVNFSIIAVGLLVIYFKFVKGMLKKRIEDIEASLAEAKAAREEAIQRLADVEARLKDKDSELARLVEVAEQNGVKEKAALIEEGGRLSEDIIASAKEGIDSELIKAKDELRREAALLALELAEKLVRENISSEDRARIMDEYIAKVGG